MENNGSISVWCLWLAGAAIGSFLAYLRITAKLHGIQPSISDNYYVSRHRWMFTMVMWMVAFGMLPAMLEVTPAMWQFSAFICCAGIAFVGAAAAFRESVTKEVHNVSAIASAAFGFLWCACVMPPMASVGFLTCCAILLLCSRHKIYWLEVTCFLTVFITYIIMVAVLG